MKRKLLSIVLILAPIAIVWCLLGENKSKPLANDLQEQHIHSASFEALSLNPIPVLNSDKLGTNADTILRYPILGHVKIDDQNLRRELVNAISQDIANANHPPSACVLEPRYGIRCIDGSNSVQIAICYRCGDVVAEENEKQEYFSIKMDGVFLSPSSKQLFDKIFREAGVKTDAQ